MNPLSPAARYQRVSDEMRKIREAWPEGRATRSADGMSAVVIIEEPHSTYVIEVDPDGSRSLWVQHRANMPDTNGPLAPPQWRDGWDD